MGESDGVAWARSCAKLDKILAELRLLVVNRPGCGAKARAEHYPWNGGARAPPQTGADDESAQSTNLEQTRGCSRFAMVSCAPDGSLRYLLIKGHQGPCLMFNVLLFVCVWREALWGFGTLQKAKGNCGAFTAIFLACGAM